MDALEIVEDRIARHVAVGNDIPQNYDTLLLLSIARDTREMLIMTRDNQKHIEALAKDIEYGCDKTNSLAGRLSDEASGD